MGYTEILWLKRMKIHLYTCQLGAWCSFFFSFSTSRRISFLLLLGKKVHSTVTSFYYSHSYFPLPAFLYKTQCVLYTYSLHLSTVPKKQHGRESGAFQKVYIDWKDACKHEPACLRLVDSCAAEPTKQLVAGARISSQLPDLLSVPLWMSLARTKVNTKKQSEWEWEERGNLTCHLA